MDNPDISRDGEVLARGQVVRAEVREAMEVLDGPGYDFMRRLDELFRDANMLRAWSVKETKNEDGDVVSVRIMNPVFFHNSIRARTELLNTSIAAMREAMDLQAQQDFYSQLIAEVSKASPEIARRIMDNLAEVRKRRLEMRPA